MRGWLDKEGKGALRVWQRRYFVLNTKRQPAVWSWFVNHNSDKPQNVIAVPDLVVQVDGAQDGSFFADHYFFTCSPRTDLSKQWRIRATGVFNGRAWLSALAAHGAFLRFPDNCVHMVALDWRELLLVRSTNAGQRLYYACLRGAHDVPVGAPDVPFAVEKRLDVIAAANSAANADGDSDGSSIAADDGILASIAVMPSRVLPLMVTLGDAAAVEHLRVVAIDSGSAASLPCRELPNAPRRVERLDDGVTLVVTMYIEVLATDSQAALYITAHCNDRGSPVCPVVVADLLSPSFHVAPADVVTYQSPASAAPATLSPSPLSASAPPSLQSPPPSQLQQQQQAPRPSSPVQSQRPASPGPSQRTTASHGEGTLYRVAKYSFSATKPSQLSIEKGDVIEVLESGGAWWRGRIYGSSPERVGKFPETYTEAIAPEEVLTRSMRVGGTASSANGATLYRAMAMFDWQSENVADLQFRKGDELHVTGQVDENWLLGTMAGGTRLGKFPRNRVERIADELPLPLPTSPSPVSRSAAPRRTDSPSEALRMLTVDETYLTSTDGDHERYRCTKEPTIPGNDPTILLASDPRGAVELTCTMGARVPLAITTESGRRDCSVKVMCGRTKLERGKQWRIESQAFRQTPAGDVTTLFVTFRYSLKLGDTLRVIASLDGQMRTFTIGVADNVAIAKRGKNGSNSSSSSSSNPLSASLPLPTTSLRLGGADAQQLAAYRVGERMRARRTNDRASFTSLNTLGNGELVALIAATHDQNAPDQDDLETLADVIVDRLAAGEVRAQKVSGADSARNAAEQSLLKMALRAHEDASERRDASLLPLLDAAVAFGVK